MNSSATEVRIVRIDPADDARTRRVQRAARAGRLVRLRPGAYVDCGAWDAASDRAKHVMRIRAALPDLPPGAVIAHESAVALFGWSRLRGWGPRVHAVDPAAATLVRRVGLVVHPWAGPPIDVSVRSDGVPVLGELQVAVSILLRSSVAESVVSVDDALRRGVVRHEELRAALPPRPARGAARAEHALEIVDCRHESAGESYLAVRLAEVRAPRAVPQYEFWYSDGSHDRVDFWLPDLGVVLEFDGRAKYEDPAMLAGRAPSEVLWAERRREERIRAVPGVRGFVRVRWWHLEDPDRLRTLLRSHGIPCR